MSTTTVFDRGAEWSRISLNDGWGEMGDGADVAATREMLAEAATKEFNRLVKAAGGRAHWSPNTSELVGPVDEDTEIDYAALRDQAVETVYNRLINGEIEPIMEE